VILAVVLASGCQASEPVVPQEIYQQVNDDGREWTYDTAWQNIRKLNADLEQGDPATLSGDALFITSQMERLERGKAGPLTNYSTSREINRITADAANRTPAANFEMVRALALRLQDSFDAGDFPTAKVYALEVHVILKALETEG
jgi:hypothetical protein